MPIESQKIVLNIYFKNQNLIWAHLTVLFTKRISHTVQKVSEFSRKLKVEQGSAMFEKMKQKQELRFEPKIFPENSLIVGIPIMTFIFVNQQIRHVGETF